MVKGTAGTDTHISRALGTHALEASLPCLGFPQLCWESRGCFGGVGLTVLP